MSVPCPTTAVQMGEALIRGFTRSGVSTWEQICASVKSKERQSALSAMGLRVYGNALNGGAADLAANSDIIFLGVSQGGRVHSGGRAAAGITLPEAQADLVLCPRGAAIAEAVAGYQVSPVLYGFASVQQSALWQGSRPTVTSDITSLGLSLRAPFSCMCLATLLRAAHGGIWAWRTLLLGTTV